MYKRMSTTIESKNRGRFLEKDVLIFSFPKPSAVITEPAKLGACSEAM